MVYTVKPVSAPLALESSFPSARSGDGQRLSVPPPLELPRDCLWNEWLFQHHSKRTARRGQHCFAKALRQRRVCLSGGGGRERRETNPPQVVRLDCAVFIHYQDEEGGSRKYAITTERACRIQPGRRAASLPAMLRWKKRTSPPNCLQNYARPTPSLIPERRKRLTQLWSICLSGRKQGRVAF